MLEVYKRMYRFLIVVDGLIGMRTFLYVSEIGILVFGVIIFGLSPMYCLISGGMLSPNVVQTLFKFRCPILNDFAKSSASTGNNSAL